MKQKLLLLFAICCTYISQANEKILIPSNQFHIDLNKALIVTNLDVNYVNTTWIGEKSSIALDTDYSFETPVNNIVIGTPYNIISSVDSKVYILYFTQLPIISIATTDVIVDEPDVLATFKMIESNQNAVVSNIGIQYRGAYSQTLPKKSLEIKFWSDEVGDETHDVSLLGMHAEDGWNLQAMYNEALRFHSKTNNDLWKLIHKPYYINSEPDAVSGIEMKYVELFLDGEYRGVYCVGEKVKRKLLKLKKHNGNIRGELYKGDSWGGASTFTFLSDYDNNNLLWDGMEYKYPNEETNWANLYDLTNFILNANEETFNNQYKSRFQIDNAVDYFIFLNLLRATDNTGKNLHVARYSSNEPYFYVPWDLDGTFGTIWNGQHENITTDLLTNGLYNRLFNDCSADGFREKLKSRWNELRSTIITHPNIMGMLVENYNMLNQNGIYARESMAWPDFNANEGEIDYISEWLTNRLSYLDMKFSQDCSDTTTLSVATFDKVANVVVYPNPTSDIVNIVLTDNSNHHLYLYDNTGRLILNKFAEGNQDQISLKNLSKGMYFIKVVDSENKVDIKRIIKE
ncbi:hypothetical protein B4N84_03055 [Flavobacterium sp. IR1]|nr:hypothetical protein B4N84_03055 [Flavobacterium sp. IR1]